MLGAVRIEAISSAVNQAAGRKLLLFYNSCSVAANSASAGEFLVAPQPSVPITFATGRMGQPC